MPCARQDGEARPLRPAAKRSRERCEPGAHAVEIGVVLAEAVGDGGLQVRRRGEGEELVRLAPAPHQAAARRRRSRPSSRSARRSCRPSRSSRCARACRARRSAGRGARPSNTTCSQTSSQIAMASWRTQKSASSARSSRENDAGGRVERVVEQHDPGLRREGRGERRLGRGASPAAPGARSAARRRPGAPAADRRRTSAGTAPPRRRARSGPASAPASASVAPEVTMTSVSGSSVEALEAAVVRGDGLAQLRQAHHRRILVPAVDDRLGGLAADVLGAGIVGKALAEIDRAGLAGEARHGLEDGGRQVGEDGFMGVCA